MEVILSSAVFALLVTALVGAYLYGEESTALAGNRARAVLLAEEGLEAVRNIRDADYANLTTGTFGLTTAGNQWNLSGSQDTSGIFTRQIIISAVDAKRKSVTAKVTWQQNPQRAGLVTLETRLANWMAVGIGNWAIPLQQSVIDLPGNNDGTKIQVAGTFAYMIRAGGVNFMILNVSNPAVPTLAGSLTLTGTPQNIYVAGNFAYVTSEDNAQELQIINIANPASPTVVGTLNMPGNTNALGIFVSGATAYIGRVSGPENEFAVINVTTPATPVLLGSLDLGADGSEVAVSGAHAYVTSSDNSQELKVISLSNPLVPTLAGSLNLAGNTDATTLALAGSILLVGQGTALHTISIATPATPLLVGSLVLGGNINDIALNTGNANTYIYTATSDTANEFKVINVTTPTAPVVLGTVNVTGNNPIFGVAYDETLDRAFVAGQSNTEEFMVITPQ